MEAQSTEDVAIPVVAESEHFPEPDAISFSMTGESVGTLYLDENGKLAFRGNLAESGKFFMEWCCTWGQSFLQRAADERDLALQQLENAREECGLAMSMMKKAQADLRSVKSTMLPDVFDLADRMRIDFTSELARPKHWYPPSVHVCAGNLDCSQVDLTNFTSL